MLSIIIPVDIDTNTYYQESLRNFQNRNDVEIIIVNKEEAFTRAERLNLGFHRSHGEMILLHHPRSKLANEAIEFLILESKKRESSIVWGGFFHKFDVHHFCLHLVSWYSNFIRFKLKGIVYLDHCIFFSRQIWERDLPIQYLFEDTELSYQFRRVKQPILLPYPSITSAHRYLKNGIFKQILLNLFLKIGYFFKLPSSFLFYLYQL